MIRTHMTHRLPLIAMALLGIGLLMLSGCENMAKSADAAGDASSKRWDITRDKWRDVFTFDTKGKPPAQLPQTRYCYRTQSDTVCYDSPQTTTSQLSGYQDGGNLSWFQPGGGSLGVSGGEPTAALMQHGAQQEVVIQNDGTPPEMDQSGYARNAVIANDISVPRR